MYSIHKQQTGLSQTARCMFATLLILLGTCAVFAQRRERAVDSWRPTHFDVDLTFDEQTIVFDRTKRYLRHFRTTTGTSPSFALAVLIGEQKKTV